MKTLSYTEEQNKIQHNVAEKKGILWFNFEKLYFDSLQEQEMVIIQRASYCHHLSLILYHFSEELLWVVNWKTPVILILTQGQWGSFAFDFPVIQ